VRRFWYNHSLPFNLANYHFFQPMVDAIALVDLEYKGHSYNSLKEKEIDEEIKFAKENFQSITNLWESTNRSIMSNECTN